MAHKREYRVLVVDDDQDVRTLVARALERKGMGIRCDVARDGIAAQNMVSVKRYDAVITDLRMPRQHGHKLIVDILKDASPPLVIVMTAVLEPKITADLLGRGVVDVVQKPLAYDVLAVKVKAFLDRYAGAGDSLQKGAAISVASQLEPTASALKAQLTDVESSFQETIINLERQKNELEEGLLDSVRVLGNLIGHHKESKGSHACRVEKMAEWIGESCGLKREQLRHVKIASLLHDVGTFGMSDDVHRKPPQTLNEEERRAFQKYPILGAVLLSEIRGAGDVVELVEAHAENFDGSGFPASRQGPDIPLEARIIRIADGYDTFLLYAPGQGALDEVREHLISQKGKAYDPALVKHALAYVTEASHAASGEETVILAAEDLEVGMNLAEDVRDEEGRFLAREGAQLTATMLPRLQKLLRSQKVKVVRPDPSGHSGEEDSAGMLQ